MIRALVVDDSQAMRKSLVHALKRLTRIECDEAQDGAEGFKKFSAVRYDILLTDINMPLMDGLKLVSVIRQNPLHAQIPIIVITTESAAEDRARALALGASAYLVKPVQSHTVVEAVKGLLKLQ
ncbi:MAG: response regulator [Myxococcota bacterium]|nr:response regulator [Myxococcota bacterium]